MSDQPRPAKSLYDSSAGEIAGKNFLAGFMRGLGGFFITVLTWVLFYYLTIHFVLPQLTGYMSEAQDMIKSVKEIQGATTNLMTPSGTGSTTTGGSKGIVIPPEMIQQFQQLQNK